VSAGSVDAAELANSLNLFLGSDFTQEQSKTVLTIFTGHGKPLLTLNTALAAVQQLGNSQSRFRTAFQRYDRDGSGNIDRAELAPLLTELGVKLSQDQMQILVSSLDFNNDGEIDLPEIEAALRRLSDTVLGRFGNVLRLFEAVALNTRNAKMWKLVATSSSPLAAGPATEVRYVSWDMKQLLIFFKANPNPNPDAPLPKWDDYGFGSNFVYGRFGDLGPLRRALPGNVMRMSVWNFGREYNALRDSFGNGDFQAYIDSLSGAGVWFASRQALQNSLGSQSDEADVRQSVFKAFDSIDSDASGQICVKEMTAALRQLGVEADDTQARAMMKIADIDDSGEIDKLEFYKLVTSVLEAGDKFDIVMQEKGVMPRFVAKGIFAVLETLGVMDRKVASKFEGIIRPVKGQNMLSQESKALQFKLKGLKLDNDAVWKREEVRREQLLKTLESAVEAGVGVGSDSEEAAEFGAQLKATLTPPVVMIPYSFLCWTLDVMYVNRPIQRFWFLETVARMPYFSYNLMLTLYETLGWWRCGMDNRRIHFAEEWNEVQHLKIMEALGGDQAWIDRFLARHSALFYFLILNHIWLISPSLAYNFSELIEFHAVDTYGEFVDANEALLRSLPPPLEAVEYYTGNDLYLFDEFQTGRAPRSRRPQIKSLYDVFACIRDDELEHVKTMFQCQTAIQTLASPNAMAEQLTTTRKQNEAVQQVAQQQLLDTQQELLDTQHPSSILGEGWGFPSSKDEMESRRVRSIVTAKEKIAKSYSVPPDF